jgi:CDP-archaeol synthase
MRLWMIARLLLLVMLANGMPVIAKKILGDRFSFALDSGTKYFDGRSVFGPSKTIRGILLSILIATASGHLLQLGYKTGALVGGTAMAGDLFSSFVKRRMKLPVSSRATGLDQLPESLLPLLACRRLLSLTVPETALALVGFFVGEILISRVLYRFRLRDRPY